MKIIYKTETGVSILHPTPEALSFATIQEIAEKDVPFGYPYWLVEDDYIPTDRTFRNAWELDESAGDPDGFGGEASTFSDEILSRFRSL